MRCTRLHIPFWIWYFQERYQTLEPSLGPRQFHVGSQTQDERYTSALMPEVDVTPRTFLSNAHCRKRQSKNKHTRAKIPKHCCFFGQRWKTLWKTWTPLERFLGRRKSVNQIIYVFIHNNESASSKRKCERYPHLPQCLPTSSFQNNNVFMRLEKLYNPRSLYSRVQVMLIQH